MPADFEIREVKPIEVGDIDIGGHDSTVDADSLGQPHSHRPAACPDFEAAPAWLNASTPLTRKGIEDVFKEVESLILGLLASRCSKAIYRFGCRGAFVARSISLLRHACYRNPPLVGLSTPRPPLLILISEMIKSTKYSPSLGRQSCLLHFRKTG